MVRRMQVWYQSAQRQIPGIAMLHSNRITWNVHTQTPIILDISNVNIPHHLIIKTRDSRPRLHWYLQIPRVNLQGLIWPHQTGT